MPSRQPVGRKLKAIRERVYGLRELARAIGWDPSKYQYYESGIRKQYLPHDFVEIIRPLLVGKGEPPVTNGEIDSLLPPRPASHSLSPVEQRLERIEALLLRLVEQTPSAHPSSAAEEPVAKDPLSC